MEGRQRLNALIGPWHNTSVRADTLENEREERRRRIHTVTEETTITRAVDGGIAIPCNCHGG